MISVVIATLNDASGLAAALSDLVPAAVDGLVVEVVLADGGSTDETLEIAEEAGARITAGGGLAGACAAAKGPWLMLLPPAPVLDANWKRPVADHVERRAGEVGLLKVVRRAFWRRTEGVLAPKARWELSGGGAETIQAMARKLGPPSRTLRVIVNDRDGRR
jgi:glycosyltransferase involved in cell wall biosynthesis